MYILSYLIFYSIQEILFFIPLIDEEAKVTRVWTILPGQAAKESLSQHQHQVWVGLRPIRFPASHCLNFKCSVLYHLSIFTLVMRFQHSSCGGRSLVTDVECEEREAKTPVFRGPPWAPAILPSLRRTCQMPDTPIGGTPGVYTTCHWLPPLLT